VAHPDAERLALIALGELDSEPDGAAAAHLAGCADCQAQVAELAAVVAVARDGGPAGLTAPPAALWDRIAAAAGVETVGVEAAEPEPGDWEGVGPEVAELEVAGPQGDGRAWWRRRPLAAAVAGVAAGLIVGIGGAIGVGQLGGPPAARVVQRVALRPLAQFPQWRQARGTAVMETGPAGRQLVVALDAPRRPGFYEVWLLARNGVSMISLGDLGPGHTGRFTMPPGVDLRDYSRIDISLQPFNGSTAHSKTSVVRGSLS
jgi:hypothetical protein